MMNRTRGKKVFIGDMNVRHNDWDTVYIATQKDEDGKGWQQKMDGGYRNQRNLYDT